MVNAPNRGKGQGIAFLRSLVGHTDDECVIWPLSNNGLGYGVFGYLGRVYYAHRFMCGLAHGPAPSKKSQAAHSCGRGQQGCVNPRHLSWKTNSENQLDRRVHGTNRKHDGIRQKLTPAQIAEVRALKGKVSLFEIAKMFGVKRGCIEYWHKHDREPMKPGISHSAGWRRRQRELALTAGKSHV